MQFHELPKRFSKESLKKNTLNPSPHKQCLIWIKEAEKENILELNAMTLATATTDGKPSSRIVLLKNLDDRGLEFYTNYESRKSKELAFNPFASATLFWPKIMRQICIEGKIERLTKTESATYFSTRPRGSQLAAWASLQDSKISSREVLGKRYSELNEKYQNKEIPLPPFWGGFRLIPSRFEFWQGGENRLHDRFEYVMEHDGWKINRLSP